MKSKYILPVVLILVFALSRWPGMMPQNFSAAYALCFCAGLYLPRKMSWALPLGVMLITDLVLSFGYYYSADYTLLKFLGDEAPVYLAYVLIIGLGNLLAGKKRGFFSLLGGGIVGAILFYLISNTASWLTMPATYGKTFAEWIRALTIGDPKFHPTTWEFFRGTFLSGGIFTALFVGAMKAVEATEESPVEKGEEAPEPVAEEEEPLAPATDGAPHPAA